jgi:hypothetical protein
MFRWLTRHLSRQKPGANDAAGSADSHPDESVRPAEAETRCRDDLAAHETILGANHPNVAVRLNDLALLTPAVTGRL